MSDEVHRRPKDTHGFVPDVATPRKEGPMSDVWMIRYDGLLHLYNTLEDAKASIVKSYPDHLVVESDHKPGSGSAIYDVALDGKIQDRIAVTAYTVNEGPTPFRRTEKRSTAEF